MDTLKVQKENFVNLLYIEKIFRSGKACVTRTYSERHHATLPTAQQSYAFAAIRSEPHLYP